MEGDPKKSKEPIAIFLSLAWGGGGCVLIFRGALASTFYVPFASAKKNSWETSWMGDNADSSYFLRDEFDNHLSSTSVLVLCWR